MTFIINDGKGKLIHAPDHELFGQCRRIAEEELRIWSRLPDYRDLKLVLELGWKDDSEDAEDPDQYQDHNGRTLPARLVRPAWRVWGRSPVLAIVRSGQNYVPFLTTHAFPSRPQVTFRAPATAPLNQYPQLREQYAENPTRPGEHFVGYSKYRGDVLAYRHMSVTSDVPV